MDRPTFAEVLRRLREARGRSKTALAAAVGTDSGYLTRCEQGERTPSTVELVDRIARALDCSPAETDQLRVAAGFLPLALEKVGPDDPEIVLLARLLDPAALPESARQAVRGVVRSLGHLLPRSPGAPD